MTAKRYSLSKSRRILRAVYTLYKRKWKKLSKDHLNRLESGLEELDEALFVKDRDLASRSSRRLEKLSGAVLRKSSFDYVRDVIVAVVFALLVALVVRQMWFEPMEIPSGSMRPTYEELDRLIVSKTDFGLNVPAMPAHFLFEPDLVKRTGVFIFTAEGMDIPNQDQAYFYIFPGKSG